MKKTGSKKAPAKVAEPGWYYTAAKYSFVAPIMAYYYYVLKYSTNYPEDDDYGAVLQTLLSYLDANTLVEKIQIIFSQHNEHRILVDRLVVLLQYFTTGAVNFQLLVIIGNILMLLVAFLLFKIFQPKDERLLLFAPAVFILFQIQFWENIYRSMAILAWTSGFILGFAALYLVAVPGYRRLLWAVFCAMLSFYTLGSGITLLFVVALLLIINGRWRELAIWMACSLGMIAAYFYGYVSPGAHPPVLEAFRFPYRTLLYLFSLMSAVVVDVTATFLRFEIDSVEVLRFVLAVLFIAHFIWLIVKKYYRENPALFGILLYLYASCFLVALTRSGFGIGQSMMWRYRILSALVVAVVYLTSIELIREKRRKYVYGIVLAAALLFNVLSYVEYDGVVREKFVSRHVGIAKWFYYKKTGTPASSDNPTLDAAAAKKIYLPPVPDQVYFNAGGMFDYRH